MSAVGHAAWNLLGLVVVFFRILIRHSFSSTCSQLVTFLLYLSSLSDAFNSIGSIFASLTQAVGAADKVFELIHRQPKIEEPQIHAETPTRESSLATSTSNLVQYGINPKKIALQRNRGLHPPSGSCRGQISFDDVEMSYPARPQRKILHGLTLKAPPGKVVALVGASGGGKSSIISLIQHLYEPSSGDVKIDGHRVQDLSYDFLSRNISIVSQEPTLFARSIHRNIIYGLEGTPYEPTVEEVEGAAKLANAHTFISEHLPQGYETDVGGEWNIFCLLSFLQYSLLRRTFFWQISLNRQMCLPIINCRAWSAAVGRSKTTGGDCQSFGAAPSHPFAR